MKSTKEVRLDREIKELIVKSEELRDQIYQLEVLEGKISDEISLKRRQLDALRYFNKE